jgi:hypothetical protein
VSNYLIRVQLPDRPGALGAVASRIGSVGGDVISIDILEREHGVVVDELGVGLAGEDLVDLLRDEVLEVDGVAIESVRPVEGPLPDRHAELLGMATELFKQRSSAGLLDHLAVRVRRSLGATFAVVYDCTRAEVVSCDGRPPDLERLAGAAASVLVSGAYRGEDAGASIPTDGIVVTENATVAAAGMAHAGLALVIGRKDPVLRERELQWLSLMAELADHGWRQLA